MKKVISLFLSIVMLISVIASVDLSAYAESNTTLDNLETYKAQCLLGTAYDEYSEAAVVKCNKIYKSYIGDDVYSPSKEFLDLCYSDDKLMMNYNEWKLYSLAASPSSALDKVAKREDYYESLIISMYSKATAENDEFKKFINNKIIKNTNIFIGTLCDIAKVSDISKLVDELDVNTTAGMDLIKQGVEQNYAPAIAGKFSSNLGKIISASNTVYDLSQRISLYGTMAELDDSTKLWINQMYQTCSANEIDTALTAALMNLSLASTDFSGAVLADVISTTFSLSKWAVKTVIDEGVKTLIGSNPVVMAVFSGLKAGKTICNLFFNTDDVCEQLYLMECIYEVESLARKVIDSCSDTFLNTQSLSNAQSFLYAVDCYFEAIIDLDIDCMEKFLDKLYNGGIIKGNQNDYNEHISALEDLRSVRENNYNEMFSYFKDAVKANFPDDYEEYFGNTVLLQNIEFLCGYSIRPGYPDGYADVLVDETVDVDVIYYPSNTTQTGYTLISDNPDVLKIDGDKATGATAGIATLTIKSTVNPNVSFSKEIKVGEKLFNIDETQANSKFKYIIEDNSIKITGLADNYKPENLIFPETIGGYPVKSVDNYAFIGATFLKSVSFSKNIVNIGECTFYNCTSLKEVLFTENIETVGDKAFFNCNSLINLNLPALKDIGKSAFANCESLVAFNISNSLRVLPDDLFLNCKSLVQIEIPYNIDEIGNGVFGGCESLIQTVAKGVKIENCILANGTTILDHNYLYGNKRVNSITLPKGIKTIGMQFGYYSSINHVFYTGTKEDWGKININYENQILSKLQTANKLHCGVNYENNTYIKDTCSPTCITDGYDEIYCKICDTHICTNVIPAYGHCYIDGKCIECGASELFEYKINSDSESITITKYNGTDSVVEVPSEICGLKVACIGESAFENCTTLVEIILPETLLSIGSNAFSKCSNLKTMDIPISVTSFGYNGIFDKCSSLEELSIPFVGLDNKSNFYTDFNELFVGENIPDSLRTVKVKGGNRIADNAFQNCATIETISLPSSVTSIGRFAFCGCTNLKNIQIPEGVTSIEQGTFGYCSSLRTINIPNSVKVINGGAFFECINLDNITIPANVTSIGDSAFCNCTSLTKTNYLGTIDQWVQIDFGKGSSGFSYGNYSSCNPISYSNNLYVNNQLLANVKITNATKINEYAFYNCMSLESITIPQSVIDIGTSAFYNCKNLKKTNYNGTVDSWVEINLDEDSNPIYYSKNLYINNELVENVELNNCKKISPYAFVNCLSLKSVKISNSVTQIGEGAFRGCKNLIKVENHANIDIINSETFYNCEKLSSVTIPDSVTSIGSDAFCNCNSLEEIRIPNSVNYIGYSAFNTSSYSIDRVYIDSLEDWCKIEFGGNGSNPLENHADLYINGVVASSIIIPNSVEKLNDFVFDGCTSTSEIILSDSVKSIGWCSLNCYNFKKLYISKSVAEIDANNFPSICIDVSPENEHFTSIDGVLFDKSVTSLICYPYAKEATEYTIPDSVKILETNSFGTCYNLKNLIIPATIEDISGIDSYFFRFHDNSVREIFYEGTQAEWSSLTQSSFEPIRIHYNATYNHYVLIDSVNPTCTEEGKNEYECSCGYKKTEYIEPLGHNYEFVEKTEPTCDWQGYTTYYCNKCNQHFTADYVEALGHTQGELIESVSPTCTTVGYNKYKCSVCNDEFFEYIEKLEHTKELVENREATCSVGATARYYCSRGDHYIWEENGIPIGHNYVDGVCTICGSDNKWDYSFDISTGGICINGYSGSETSIIIPNELEGYPVTCIGEFAFSGNTNITSIDFPKSLKNIGICAFEGCMGITSITIPENVTSIGSSAFNDTVIEKVVFNAAKCSMSYIDDYYFLHGDCGNYAIYWGDGGQFPYCKEIIFGDNVEYIPSTFSTLNGNLTSIEFSNSLETIGYCAFYGCKNLSSITIANHKLTIENWAFDSCNKLNDVYYSGTKSQWNNVNIKEGNDALLNSNIYCTDGTICKEHNWNDGVVKVIPTCKEKGQLLRICLNCGATKTEEIPMQHNLIDGICGTCGMLEEDCIESSHPYANNFDNTWTINKPNAKRIAITFSESTETESCDYIYLYDSNDNQIGKYSGTELAGKRVNVKGDTVKIRLVTDSSVTYYGFSVTNVQVYYDDCTHSKTELRNEKTANCANSGYTGDVCCVECDEVINKGETIPKTNNHNMGERVVEPTCSEQGYTEYHCCDCNHSYKTDYIPATGIHTYVNGFCKDCKAKDPECVLPVINSGESQTVEIKNDGDYYYVTFTPKSNGTCTFSSIGNYDTYGYLYDENMNELTSNDDGGDNYNFSINYDLQVGRTYIFACRMLNSDEIGTFNVTLEFDEEEHEHSYVAKTIKPTCTAKGYTIFTCECGDSYVDNYVNATGHSWDNGKVTKAATCSSTGVKTYTCTICGETKTETLAKTAHTYKTGTTKATISKNGSIITKCSVCGNVSKNTTIYYPKTITLSKTSYTYNGKVQKPTVTVKGSNGKVISSNNYTVTYQSGRKNVGKYSIKITFKGNYSGNKTLYFTINPKATTLSSVTAKSKGFTVKWKKQATQTTGYEIQYATDSKFTKNKKIVTVSKNKTTSKTISKLKAKKKYYVRIRTYKTVKVNGKSTKIYSSWGKSKTITTKK